MVKAFVGLGSNIGEREKQVWDAVEKMDAQPGIRVIGVSTLLNTRAIGPIDQPDFINAVAHVETTLEPGTLLAALLSIEQKMGRVRDQRWGPRVIDLDILLYGDRKVDEPQLKIPHPEIPNRPFWQEGLRELGYEI